MRKIPRKTALGTDAQNQGQVTLEKGKNYLDNL